jgi:hypothetical protein
VCALLASLAGACDRPSIAEDLDPSEWRSRLAVIDLSAGEAQLRNTRRIRAVLQAGRLLDRGT